jgi:protein-disulfide isomerase
MSSPPGMPGGSRRTQLIVLGVLAALIVVVAIVINQSGSEDETSSTPAGDDTAQVEQTLEGIPQDGVFLGEADAPETVTEFVDLQCPFCGEYARKALPEVIDQHVRSGEVRLELRVISFLGQDSGKAAQMAAAATLQNKLFDFAETFYLNQGEENSGYVTDDFLTQIAEATPGLDADQALADRDSPEAQAVVDDNEGEASKLGVNSTPTFFLVAGGEPTEMQLTDLTADAFTQALESARGG